MPWWIPRIVFPILQAVIGILIGWIYVKFRTALYDQTSQGQLFFLSVGLAASSLAIAPSSAASGLTVAALWMILLLSVALFAVAIALKYHQAPNPKVANFLIIGGSLGMAAWAIAISAYMGPISK